MLYYFHSIKFPPTLLYFDAEAVRRCLIAKIRNCIDSMAQETLPEDGRALIVFVHTDGAIMMYLNLTLWALLKCESTLQTRRLTQ